MIEFSEAEQEILDLMADNPAITVKEIGVALGKAPKTIENQMGRIFNRLDIEGHNKTIQLYMQLGWVQTK